MIVKLLTEHHMAFLSLKGGCTGSSEPTLVKMSNCWKSHATAQLVLLLFDAVLVQYMLHQIMAKHSYIHFALSQMVEDLKLICDFYKFQLNS